MRYARPPDGPQPAGPQPGQTGAGPVGSAGKVAVPREGRDDGAGRDQRLREDRASSCGRSWPGRRPRGGRRERPHVAGDPRPPPPLRLDPGPPSRAGPRRGQRPRRRGAAHPGADRARARQLPWGELGVDVVVESTGRFTDRADAAGHLAGSVTRVVISAPSADADATFVVGVNDDTFDPATHVVVSNASCTTNCFVPMVKVLDDAFGVVQRAHDDGARLHERPEPGRLPAQGPAACPGRGDQHRPDLDRRGPRDRAGARVDEGPPRRDVAARARCPSARSPTSPPCSRATPPSPRSTRPSPRPPTRR